MVSGPATCLAAAVVVPAGDIVTERLSPEHLALMPSRRMESSTGAAQVTERCV